RDEMLRFAQHDRFEFFHSFSDPSETTQPQSAPLTENLQSPEPDEVSGSLLDPEDPRPILPAGAPEPRRSAPEPGILRTGRPSNGKQSGDHEVLSAELRQNQLSVVSNN
ncbi:MAG: hypothetical protein ACRD3T_19275, partial [Terriglobia bacterium]